MIELDVLNLRLIKEFTCIYAYPWMDNNAVKAWGGGSSGVERVNGEGKGGIYNSFNRKH